jgi:nucleoside-diphosphate-sugar epimerase
MTILITGAAGNLGSLLATHLLAHTDVPLKLMVHQRDVPPSLKINGRSEVVKADLANRSTLHDALAEVDTIVHFAGVLFKSSPELFLPTTNVHYFQNLVDVAKECGVQKVILISFPHVEGPTSFEHPAQGTLNGRPISVHASTRLEEEKYLLSHIHTPIILRVGMVYGSGILMIDTARWFAKHDLLGVWKDPTQIHLISKIDFCRAVTAAITKPGIHGIYHIGDEGKVTLQEFLSIACSQWRVRPPWQMPLSLIYLAARFFEWVSRIFNTRAPLTKDFIDIGRVSYYGDTTRMRNELLPTLEYPSITEGRETL